MKKILLISLLGLLFICSGCSTYKIVELTAKTDLYSTAIATDADSTISAGSVLLLKGNAKNGMVQARFHTDPTWYWINDVDFSLIPNVNTKAYDQLYAGLESANPAGVTPNTGYDATIQTGSRGGKYYINKNGKKTYVKGSTPSGSTKSVGGKGSRGGRH